MATEFTLQRNIVKKGILVLEDENREVSQWQLWGQVEREPESTSASFRYPVPQKFYGYAQGLFRGYVVWTVPLQYPNQLIAQNYDVELQKFPSHVCLHQFTYDLLQKVAFTAFVADNPGKHPLGLQASRIELDAIAVCLLPGCTYSLRFIGRDLNIPCENPIEWNEPLGPPSNGDPTAPAVPPAPVPVNPYDPNGWDLPDVPYDRDSDDNGYSYDPEREEDQGPPPLGAGIYNAKFSYTGGDGAGFTIAPVAGGSCIANPRTGDLIFAGGITYPRGVQVLWDDPTTGATTTGSSGTMPSGGEYTGTEFIKVSDCP